MAEVEPAELFRYNRPVAGAFVDANEISDFLKALARTHYTTNAINPQSAQDGQPRVNAVDQTNIKLQFWLNGAWRTVLQQLNLGVASPVKQIVQFDTPTTSWVIDHNLGSQVVAQVFDASFTFIPPSGASALPQELMFLGHIPSSVLVPLSGVQTLRADIPMLFDGTVLKTFAVAAEITPITGPPVGSIEFELSGAGGVMTGGVINLASGAALGVRILGSTVTGNNTFVAGDTLEVRSDVTTAPIAGALDLYAEVERSVAAAGSYSFDQVTDNRIIITHAAPTTGFVVLVG